MRLTSLLLLAALAASTGCYQVTDIYNDPAIRTNTITGESCIIVIHEETRRYYEEYALPVCD